ncbi:conserved hypothetical protein [Ricinus communis]|uniref:Uncharacterized protein n=1 Tax=Ricinus communis TaxID=3988 RepID=B9RIB0_RICCO|nr:conserved hypothetical protein [Ricinus communis]
MQWRRKFVTWNATFGSHAKVKHSKESLALSNSNINPDEVTMYMKSEYGFNII